MATLTNYLTYVRERLGVPATDSMFTDAQVTNAVNQAIHALDEEHDWPWCQASATIATSTSTIVLSAYVSTWKRVVSLSIPTEDHQLTNWPADDLLAEPTTNTGMPDRYALWAENIEVRPAPDASYSFKLGYIKRETDLSSGSDQPLLPSQFDGAVISYAAYLLATREGDTTNAAVHLAAYNDWVRRMRDSVRRYSGTKRVSVRPGGWI